VSDAWYHKVGEAYDLCGAAFEGLAGGARDGFV
jgi:hypothetical protein